MGNILRKIVRQKKVDEKNAHYWKLYRMYAHLPYHLQSNEFIKLQAERNKKSMLELSNFLKELSEKIK